MTKLRVLLVEDDDDNREMLVMILTSKGFEVIATSTCAEAREVVAQQTVDVVLMDMALPDGLGEDLARELRQASDAPRIALSGRLVADSDLFAGTILKPIYPAVLLAKIQAALAAKG